jgi:hypothetical protein
LVEDREKIPLYENALSWHRVFGAVPGLSAARADCNRGSAGSVKSRGLKTNNREKQQLMSRVKNEFHLAYECPRSFKKDHYPDTVSINRTKGEKSCRQDLI